MGDDAGATSYEYNSGSAKTASGSQEEYEREKGRQDDGVPLVDPEGRYRVLTIMTLAVVLGLATWFSATAVRCVREMHFVHTVERNKRDIWIEQTEKYMVERGDIDRRQRQEERGRQTDSGKQRERRGEVGHGSSGKTSWVVRPGAQQYRHTS